MPMDLSKEFEIIKKPLRFKCIQFTGLNHNELKEFCGSYLFYDKEGKPLLLSRKGPRIRIEGGDYIIKDEFGFCSFCTPKEFETIYDVIEPVAEPIIEEDQVGTVELIEPKENSKKVKKQPYYYSKEEDKAKDQVSPE